MNRKLTESNYLNYFISTKDVMKLTGLQASAAYARIALVRDALGKKKLPNNRYQPVTHREFCEYYAIPLNCS